MPIEQTLATVDELIAVGDLRAARIRLRSLVLRLPQRLDLRDRLADVYRLEGNVAQAGRWSYLHEQRDAAEDRAFERCFGNDPIHIMAALRWRGHEDDASDEAARARLRRVKAAAEEKAGKELPWEMPAGPQQASAAGGWAELGCFAVGLGILVLVGIGIGKVAEWLGW